MLGEAAQLGPPMAQPPPLRRVGPPAQLPQRTPGTVPNSIIGVAILIAAELMFFGGLITAFLVLRAGAMFWPPPGQPRLPIGITGLNTLILLASGLAMYAAARAMRRQRDPSRYVKFALLGGVIFLAVQGSEWLRLLSYGLRLTGGFYGGLFTTIIGAHALHVACGLLALGLTTRRIRRDLPGSRAEVHACSLYWSFVVLIWPILYVLVYLS